MLKADRSELDYVRLANKARRLQPGSGTPLRIALLADVSTQHLAPLLRALLAGNGVDAQIYEAGYDTIEQEAIDPGSGLHAFGPDVIVILQSAARLEARYLDVAGDRASFTQEAARRVEDVWRAIRARSGATIVQSTFVLPCSRPHGNYGALVADTLQSAVRELNREIGLRARENPGVLINDLDELAGWLGRRHFTDEKLWALSKSICALDALPDVAQNIVDVVLAARGRTVKCVVLDLDNTLWGGVVGDDGLDGIELGERDETGAFRTFQLHMRELSRRGIILAVCSKNDDAVARRVFREHPGMVLREQDIAVFVANWEDKATNIRRIRDKLDIGLDSMVFLDDSPFERNLVRQMLPEVIVPELPEDPVLYVRALAELNLFETASHSALDALRGALYRENEHREEERSRFTSLDEYLVSLETTARVAAFEPADLPRIAQLLQRSNQFNLTTRRHSEATCAAVMSDPSHSAFTISIRDRFGDFGLINVVILRRDGDALEVDTFVMSCRVLKRGVEQLAMNRVFEIAGSMGARSVVGRYLPTAKNAMVRDFYGGFGFRELEDPAREGTSWILDVAQYVPREVHISVAPLAAGQRATG